jgi:hypothetical protein
MKRYIQILLIAILYLSLISSLSAEGLAVEITSPATGTNFTTGTTVDISVTLTIESGTIESAKLYQNGWLLSTLNVNTPNYSWKNVPSGNYELTVRAVDDQENEVTSDPVTIHVGGVLKYDKALNGEFTPTGTMPPWPWRFDKYVGAQATFELDNVGLSDDTSAAYMTFQELGTEIWSVQLMQQFRLQAGHKYEVYFKAWAMQEKPIQITFSMDYDPWDTHWYTDITLSEEPQEYGPYTYESTVDDSLVMMKFILSFDATELYLDAVRILDIHPSTGIEGGITRPINNYRLDQNYPNPFNPKTNIPYALPVRGHIDLLGQKVATLVSGKQPAGQHHVQWDAAELPAGIYFYQLVAADGFTITKKLVLLK